MKRARTAALLGPLLAAGCAGPGGSGIEQPGGFRVSVTEVDGKTPPTPEEPLAANTGDRQESWRFAIEALDGSGAVDASFAGLVRVSVEPGAVLRVLDPESKRPPDRNLAVAAGRAEAEVSVTAVFGPSRLWVQDLGYEPASPGLTPACANGVDDDGDGLTDYPADPGCAFADDMGEQGSTLRTGVSPPVAYALPAIADVQGRSSETPYPSVAVEVLAGEPHYLVVTRVSSSGFFVTDLHDPDEQGYNHLFAYNFNTPENMRICDRLTYLAGTAAEFFGFTELSFPSYVIEPIYEPKDCRVPEPVVLDGATIDDEAQMERLEAGLVRVEGYAVSPYFGPEPAELVSMEPEPTFKFAATRSSCDLNGDGVVDYYSQLEGACSEQCAKDPQCSEWSAYAERGNYKVFQNLRKILVNTSTAGGFDPPGHRGKALVAVTGTLRHFSGGDLNWTIETRCGEDLVCDADDACAPKVIAANAACVVPRTKEDNEAATN
ncbi:MAG: hypothetical protein HY744_30605 [Deltaproteobacteria bacterium]|nr:hypothetical protein [Deltaproteobacteria bacterium]